MNGFEQFLNPGEKVLGTFKPHKARFIIFGILGSIIGTLAFCGIGILMLATNGQWVDEATQEVTYFTFEPFIPIAIGLIIFLVGVVGSIVTYNKTLYGYTDQRVLFRSGFIGKDFHFLEYKNIQGMSVYVDLVDKFFRPNTGTIIFMSSAIPMMAMMARGGNRNNLNNGYTFKSVGDAYGIYKQLNDAYNEAIKK